MKGKLVPTLKLIIIGSSLFIAANVVAGTAEDDFDSSAIFDDTVSAKSYEPYTIRCETWHKESQGNKKSEVVSKTQGDGSPGKSMEPQPKVAFTTD